MVPSNDEILKINVFVHLVNHAFPYPGHVWGAMLMNSFFCIQYALWLSSSEASRALACQQSHLLPWLQNARYAFAPCIHSAPFLLLLPCIVPSSALSPGPSLISRGGSCLEEGTFTKQTEIPEWAGVSQDHHETNKNLVIWEEFIRIINTACYLRVISDSFLAFILLFLSMAKILLPSA